MRIFANRPIINLFDFFRHVPLWPSPSKSHQRGWRALRLWHSLPICRGKWWIRHLEGRLQGWHQTNFTHGEGCWLPYQYEGRRQDRAHWYHLQLQISRRLGQYVKQKCHIDGLVQDCSNSSALAMESVQSCTKSSIYQFFFWQDNIH